MRPVKDQFGSTARVMFILPVMLIMVASCLKDMPETFPETVEWDPQLAFPLGENSYGLNSVSGFDTTLLEIDPSTELPDWVDMPEVAMRGTMEFSLASIQRNLNNINRILFRVNLYNGFPNEILAQAYFRDASMSTIDSMFLSGPMLVAPGIVQGDGETVQPTHARQDAIFDRARLQSLENASELYFIATILVTDPDTTLISYYPSYEFDVRIGAMLDLSLEF